MQINYYFTVDKIYNTCTRLNTSQLILQNKSQFGHFKYVIVIFNNKFTGKYFNLYDINDYKCIITKKSNLKSINNISYYCHHELLEWFYNKKDEIDFKYSNYTIHWVLQNGHLNVIEWFSRNLT